MENTVRRLKIAVTLTVVLSLAIVLLTPPSLATGIFCEVDTGELPLLVNDLSAVPKPVVEAATRLSMELCGDYPEKCDDLVTQLLTTYLEAKEKDFVTIFNPGGWGWNLIGVSAGWRSILDGIKSELSNLGYTLLPLNYMRTIDTAEGRGDEVGSMISLHPSKANDLALRIEFLTNNIPDLKVILAGESTGTVICDRVMNILKDNPQVYSIQTGPPFWHNSVTLDRTLDRTLVITDNGLSPDSFSKGDIFTILRANLETLFGFPLLPYDSGNILKYVRAPGHEYWWQYPEVSPQITSFLEKNFGIR
ncbi:hypothetical protein ACFLTZ_01315 [Chloroflexota bacterium]